jgi:nucleoside phosphorylase
MEAGTVKDLMTAAHQVAGSPAGVTGRIGVNEIGLFITGIGPKKAEASARNVLLSGRSIKLGPSTRSRRPDAILVIGLCGSLTSSIDEGEVVLYTDCLSVGTEQARESCTTPLIDRINDLFDSRGLSCRKVVGITSPRVATSKAEKLALATSGAEVVDMESHPIIVAAIQAQIPVAVIRVVSDSLDREMPDFNQVLKPDGEVDNLAMAKVLICSPEASLRLFSISRKSTQKLRDLLEVLLSSSIFSY